MVNQSAMNLLFFLGVLIPALVTIALFVIFCVCWYKMRLRNEILYKKHDPHKIDKLKEGEIYEAPTPPPPPFKTAPSISEMLQRHNNNNIKNKPNNDDYEESPEPEEGFDNPTMYRTNPDSGFSDLNHIQCNVNNVNNAQAPRQDADSVRPNSQASDDSDDSGFRSSRSGQYIHSASSSAGNAQETYNGEHSCQTHDAVPLFKPIKIHPNESGRPPIVSYVHRNSSKHKQRKLRNCPPSSSQHYNMEQLSRATDNENMLFTLDQPVHTNASIPNNSNSVGQIFNMHQQHYSESNNDVHGGRLHSITSHLSPLSSIGHFGQKPNVGGHCGHMNNGHRNGCCNNDGGHFSQPNSIGYGSDSGSLGPHLNDPQYHRQIAAPLGGQINTNSVVGYTHSLNNPGPATSLGYPGPSTSLGYPGGPSTSLGYPGPTSSPGYPGLTNSQGYPGPVSDIGFTHSEQSCHTPFSNSVSMKGALPTSGYIPGYDVSHSLSHMRPVQTDVSGHKFGEPLQTVCESPMQLSITKAMIHRPSYIEELSDPSLYSVV